MYINYMIHNLVIIILLVFIQYHYVYKVNLFIIYKIDYLINII